MYNYIIGHKLTNTHSTSADIKALISIFNFPPIWSVKNKFKKEIKSGKYTQVKVNNVATKQKPTRAVEVDADNNSDFVDSAADSDVDVFTDDDDELFFWRENLKM